MRHWMWLAGAGGIMLTAEAHAQSDAGALAGITALRDRFVSLYNRGDTTDLGRLYAADAVRLPYDAPAVVGRRAIVASLAAAFGKRQYDPTLALTAEEVVVLGDQAMERGTYHETLRPRRSGAPLSEDGKYVALLQRGPDGGWRYRWSIFNRDRAPGR